MTAHLTSFALVLGLILSSVSQNALGRKITGLGTAAGFLLGCVVFGVRLWDPRGTNLMLISFNRWLIIAIAAIAFLATLCALLSLLLEIKIKNKKAGLSVLTPVLTPVLTLILTALVLAALVYLTPPVLQFTREFVYFGESGVSTSALLRALGFTLGLAVCLLLCLSAFETHRALDGREKTFFLFCSLLIFALEFGVRAVAALQRLKIIPLTDWVFQIMMLWDEYPNLFIFSQLTLGLLMLAWVIATHRKPRGEFANRALLRKEKARLRDCRRWAESLLAWGVAAVFILVVLHYYDTRPPAEVRPEPYDLENGTITIALEKVSDGHLHKFSYVTPNGFDVRFLVVKKPAGTAYGVGLDACEICGIAGYYERGDEEVICRRCDVVMNKNTIGFHGGCNPIPFDYEVKNSKIFIDVNELIRHERRFK